jgi:hypothetical protein
LQVFHVASVQKRDLTTDAYNMLVGVTQQVLAQIGQGQIMIKGLESQIANAIANVTAGLQDLTTAIAIQVYSFPGCATAETANLPILLDQTGMLLHQLY